MKRLLLCAGFLATLPCTYAQTSETTHDDALINIDQASVTSGIIYERVVQFANLYNFNTQFRKTAKFNS